MFLLHLHSRPAFYCWPLAVPVWSVKCSALLTRADGAAFGPICLVWVCVLRFAWHHWSPAGSSSLIPGVSTFAQHLWSRGSLDQKNSCTQVLEYRIWSRAGLWIGLAWPHQHRDHVLPPVFCGIYFCPGLSALAPATAVALSPKSNAEWTVKLPGEHWQSCKVLHRASGEAWKSALYVVYFYLM